MHRYLVFVVLCFIAVSEACQPPPCHWSDAKPIEDYFNKVANVMIAADRKAQNFCRSHGGPTVKEDHKPKQYRLIYPNPEGDVFEVKVRDRVLLVRAENCMGAVADVRIIPAYVEPRGAHYAVEDDHLIITFPYKFDPVMGGGVCIPPDPSIIVIPPAAGGGCTNCIKREW